MASITEIPGFMSIPEAATALRVSDRMVRRWVQDGRLPHQKAGAKVRLIPQAAVEKFAKIERKPGPKPA